MKTKNQNPASPKSSQDELAGLFVKVMSLGTYKKVKEQDRNRIALDRLENIKVKDNNCLAAGSRNKIQVKNFNSIAVNNYISIVADGCNRISICNKNQINVSDQNNIVGGLYNDFKVKNNNIIACRCKNAIQLDGTGNMIIAANDSKVKGKKGNAVCMVEFDENNNITGIKSAIIDGEILKEDTYYTLKDGEFIEVK